MDFIDDTESDVNESAEEQQDISRVPPQLQPHVFKKGQSGNPAGRPAGKSLKEYAKEMLASMTDEERQNFLNGIDKKVLWEMAEGKPKQENEHAGKNGQPIHFIVDSATLERFSDGDDTTS